MSFPARHDNRGNAVAQKIYRGASHIQEGFYAKNQGDALERQTKSRQCPGQDNQAGTGDSSGSFAGEHQRQEQQDLPPQIQVDPGGLRHEEGGEGKLKRGAIQVERIAGGHDERGDAAGDSEFYHALERVREGGFG